MVMVEHCSNNEDAGITGNRRTTSSSTSISMSAAATFLLLLCFTTFPTLSTSFQLPAFSPVSPILHKPSTSTSTTLHGIPKMFRWLTDQYPAINRRLSEGLTPDTIVDNFYLDMNGIIHPCTHGNVQDSVVILDEKLMFQKIFAYVDRLYKLVRPRQVLFLAVDGVAPRAKMNQQRSRRFRSGKEAEALVSDLLSKAAQSGAEIPERHRVFDSNCITPGTDFMLKLSLAFEKWIEYKMETDEFWKNGAQVYLSGPDVPGEGEHKVMDWIRELQAQNTNQTYHHVLYGLDADLIMLGLVTHEPKFTLLREKMSVVMAGRNGRRGKKKDMLQYDRNDFELLELNILRQMFKIQFRKLDEKMPNHSSERIVDDFVFLCMLVGNDFLPHMPHLEIDNGALSLMMSTYVDLLPVWKGYLTEKHKISPERFEHFLYVVGQYEQEHFRRRSYEENEPGWALPPHDDEFHAFAEHIQGEEEEKIIKKYHKKHPGDVIPPSYRSFYYATKLQNTTFAFRRQHVKDYLEGLHWVLGYYHNGCPAWNWYFPHLYSPLCTDMVHLRDFYSSGEDDEQEEFVALPFDLGTPLPSLAQLLSVLPPSSADLLPKPLAELMIHPSSPIAQFYPREFLTDPNGKRQPWEHVVHVPFVDEDLLMKEVERITSADYKPTDLSEALTEKERRRNMMGEMKKFVPVGYNDRKIFLDQDHVNDRHHHGMEKSSRSQKDKVILGRSKLTHGGRKSSKGRKSKKTKG